MLWSVRYRSRALTRHRGGDDCSGLLRRSGCRDLGRSPPGDGPLFLGDRRGGALIRGCHHAARPPPGSARTSAQTVHAETQVKPLKYRLSPVPLGAGAQNLPRLQLETGENHAEAGRYRGCAPSRPETYICQPGDAGHSASGGGASARPRPGADGTTLRARQRPGRRGRCRARRPGDAGIMDGSRSAGVRAMKVASVVGGISVTVVVHDGPVTNLSASVGIDGGLDYDIQLAQSVRDQRVEHRPLRGKFWYREHTRCDKSTKTSGLSLAAREVQRVQFTPYAQVEIWGLRRFLKCKDHFAAKAVVQFCCIRLIRRRRQIAAGCR